MGIMNSNALFIACKRKSEPIYKVPRNLLQVIPIKEISKSGIFLLEEKDSVKLYDKVYRFDDMNYATQDTEEQKKSMRMWMKLLNSLNVDFKFLVSNQNRDMDQFAKDILHQEDKNPYPDIAKANNDRIFEALDRGNLQVEQVRYFIVTCRRKSLEEAKSYFNVLEVTCSQVFASLKSNLTPLSGEERLKALHGCYKLGRRIPFQWKWEDNQLKNWRNEIIPMAMEKHRDYITLDSLFVSILVATRYPNRLEEDKVVSALTNVPFHLILAMDVAPIPRQALKNKLASGYINNEAAISREQDTRLASRNYANGISYLKRKRKEELEGYLDQVDANDENGFYLGLMVLVYGTSLKDLEDKRDTIRMIGEGLGLGFEPYYHRQEQAMNTCLPVGARRVDHMRSLLTSSMVAFQPFYSQEIMQPGGIFYGINKVSKNIIVGNRKTLKNPMGGIYGETGSGKGMFEKGEMGQVLVSTQDDIFILDPQGEFKEITKRFGGQYYELSPESSVYLNFLEIPEEIMYSEDQEEIRKFIGEKSGVARAFCASIMGDLLFTGFHTSIVDRCIGMMYEEALRKPQPVSPTLFTFRKLIGEQKEPEARDIYIPLEAFTEGSMNMFAHQSNVSLNKRLVTFSLQKIAKAMWEPAMLIVMHILSQRMDYNQEMQRATWLYVDEAQEVCKVESSALQLDKAFRTFRKYGGICTMIMQNVSSALQNDTTRDMISAAEFKVFLGQSGADRNAMETILELSTAELQEVLDAACGQGLLIWGRKHVLLDATIPKDNPLYSLYSTNFHERIEDKKKSEDM